MCDTNEKYGKCLARKFKINLTNQLTKFSYSFFLSFAAPERPGNRESKRKHLSSLNKCRTNSTFFMLKNTLSFDIVRKIPKLNSELVFLQFSR